MPVKIAEYEQQPSEYHILKYVYITTNFLNKLVVSNHMQIEALKQVIEEQRREIDSKFKKEEIIKRNGLSYTKKFLGHPNILVILGIRRSGKSIFSLLLSKDLKENATYVNFDDERLLGTGANDLNKILQAFYELYGDVELVILDEIQNVKGWELFANRLRRTKKVIVTGSNSKLLSGELSTHLTGRHIGFTLYPFSFREILDFEPNPYLTEDTANVRNQLNKYIRTSGFPEFRKFGSEIVVRIYKDIINKDCLIRHKIRDAENFRELSNYLISNFSNEFTYSKLSKLFGIKDVHTVKNYVSYLQEAFLITVLKRFSPKLKQQVIAPKKIYATDQGFCNFIGFRMSKDIGRLFENIVCIELMRRKATNHGMEIYYWKNHQGNEVDFIVKDIQKVKQLIQVCYDMDNHDTKERETGALIKASKELKCKNLLLITENDEGGEEIEGKKIMFVPLWKWLLEADSKTKPKPRKN